MDINKLELDASRSRRAGAGVPAQKAEPPSDDGGSALWTGGTSGDGDAMPPVGTAKSVVPRIEPRLDSDAASSSDRRPLHVEVVDHTRAPALPIDNAPRSLARAQQNAAQVSSPISIPVGVAERPVAGASVAPAPEAVDVFDSVNQRGAGAAIGEQPTPPASQEPPVPSKSLKLPAGARLKLAFAPVAGVVDRVFGQMRARLRAKAAAKQQRENDEENKTASTKKSNPAKIVAGVLVLGVVLSLVAKQWLSGVETTAQGTNKSTGMNTKAVQAATDLLNGDTARPVNSANAPNPALTENRPVAAAQAETSAAAAFNPPPAQVPPSTTGDDQYMRQLKELKGEMKEGIGTAPSRLPPEIARAEIPNSHRDAPSREGDRGQSERSELPKIPDEIEGAVPPSKVRLDPLDRVAIVGRMAIARNGTAPYLVGEVRDTANGTAVYLYPKNSDPVVTGHWLLVGDQTDEGWTLVAVLARGVNVVSPTGKLYAINFGNE